MNRYSKSAMILQSIPILGMLVQLLLMFIPDEIRTQFSTFIGDIDVIVFFVVCFAIIPGIIGFVYLGKAKKAGESKTLRSIVMVMCVINIIISVFCLGLLLLLIGAAVTGQIHV